MPHEVDAIVVGGGPAGAAAATVLARAGKRVLVVEKSRFPRYHVGESLLPHAWHTLDRLGALDKIKAAGFQDKRAVAFVTREGRLSRPFRFDEHTDHDLAHTWQVDRAEFDRLMLEHAAECGAEVWSETKATGLIEDDAGRVIGVTTRGLEGERTVHAPWTVDCSGRDGLVRTARGWRNNEAALQRIALWTYFEQASVPDDLQDATTIVQLPDDGWFWVIPMTNGVTSVGVVAQRKVLFGRDGVGTDPQAAFDAAVQRNPWLKDCLDGAVQTSGMDVTSDYSYRSTWCADDGVALAGDAFSFLDPVFSSGVFLALVTGERAAQTVLEALDAGRTDAAAFDEYGAWICRGLEAMRSLVFSFYDPEFSMGRLIRERPELRTDVTDVLIGHLFRDYDALQDALRTFGDVPEPLAYGRARVVDPARAAAS